jgi:hypothetical protein
MIDRRTLLLAGGCVFFAAVIAGEVSGGKDDNALVTEFPTRARDVHAEPPAPRVPLDSILAATLARPLFDSTRRPPRSTDPASSATTDKRLAGIIIEPGRHLAIFAAAGAKTLELTEGETVDGWRIERITPRQISLRGPSGIETFQPKLDPNLVPRPLSQPAVNPAARLPAQPTGRPSAALIPRARPPGPAAAALP